MSERQTILITGTSSGFGHGATLALATRGHRVFAAMRDVTGKNRTVAERFASWAAERDHDLQVVEIDVTDERSVERGVATVVDRAERLDVLVHNAGVGTWGLQEGFTADQVQKMFDVNVFGVLRMNRAVLPHMRRAGSGCVIYVSSGLGRIQLPFLGPYTASKHALEAIAETGSYELRPSGIETSILQPGAYGTEFHANAIQPEDAARLDGQPAVRAMFEAFGGAFEERIRSGQLADPQEVVEALVELVEAPPGERPFRVTVGEDIRPGVVPINETCARVQRHLLSSLGLSESSPTSD